MVSEAGVFLVGGGLVHHFTNIKPSGSLRRTYYGRLLSPPSQTDLRKPKKSDDIRI